MPIEKTKTTSFILFGARRIPLSARKFFLGAVFSLFYHISAKHRLIALHNLKCAFPEKDMKTLISIAKGVYRNLAIMAAEFFDMPYITRANLHEWVEVEGFEHYEAGIGRGKGLIFFVAHFGNWELMTVTVPLLLQPFHIIYRPLDNPALDNIIQYVRMIHGNIIIPKGGTGKRVRELLGQNQFVGIMSDQNVATYEGIFVDFFGRPACTGAGLAALALRTGAAVLPGFMVRQKSGRYKLILKPLVEISSTGDDKVDLWQNTQRLTKVVEDTIRAYPDQWLWIHQRWKTKMCQSDKS